MNSLLEPAREMRPEATVGLEFLTTPPEARAVVVFVHGLGGHRHRSWGAAGQPGAFMMRLQADLPHAAVATCDYTSELKTILADDCLTLDAMAQAWAGQVRHALLARFDTVVIVAHCLGGLLTTMSVCALLGDCVPAESGAWRGKQLALFLLDAPHDLPDDGPGPWLAGLLNALKLSPADMRANAAAWRRQVLACRALPLSIQAYALTSGQASWVTPLHPDADLPPARVCRARLSHEELTRAPAQGAFMPYGFVLSRLHELL